MGKTKRQHFVPRFLLKRFACRTAGEESFVWQFRGGAPGVQVNVVNAGVEKYFYGDEDQSIEKALSVREGRDRDTLDRVEQAESLDGLAGALWDFVWMQFVRTRAIRQRFESTARELIDQMQANVDVRSVRRNVIAEAERTIDARLAKEFPLVPLKQRWLLRQQAMREVKANAEQLAAPYQQILKDATGVVDWSKASQAGHLNGLRRLIASGPAPNGWRPKRWIAIRRDPGTFVLGDGIVVAMASGRPVFPSGGNAATDAVYAPVSSRTCLVGLAHGDEPVLSDADINRLFAAQSCDALYASRNSDEVVGLAGLVGTQEYLLDEDHLKDLVAENQVGILPPRKEK